MDASVLITLPSLNDQGGVASYYNSILPYLQNNHVEILEIGRTGKSSKYLHPIYDQMRFAQRLSKGHPQLVHINPSLNFNCLIREGLFAWQAKKKGVPFVVFWRGWSKEFEKTVEKRLLRFFKNTLGQANASIVLSSEFKDVLESWGISAPIYTESTCVADELLYDFEAEQKWNKFNNEETIRVLFLARLEREKGIFETIDVINMLVEKGFPVTLTVAGDGSIRNECEEYTRSLGVDSDRIVFLGDVRGDKKSKILREHHIYCFPTYYGEGMPNSVLEAMAFGMPVITRPVGGLVDMFQDQKMGYLVKGKRPEEIANCLAKLILDRKKMAEIGLYNADYSKKHFMASVVSKRLLEIYDDILRNDVKNG